jgi:hypothetical protein
LPKRPPRNHLEQMIHTEACGKESLSDLIFDPPSRIDQRA